MSWILVAGLRAEHSRGGFLCPCCREQKPPGSYCVLVPPGIKVGDSDEVISALAHSLAFQAGWRKWCNRCGANFLREIIIPSSELRAQIEAREAEPASSWINRARRWLARVIGGGEA